MNTTQNPSVSTTEPKTIKFGDFGRGRYSPVMEELYRDSIRLLSFGEAQAHATAARLGIDLGRLSSATAKVTYGKTTNKDGMRTVREVCSLKMPNSWALSVAVICNGLDGLRAQGLVTIDNTLSPSLLEFVNNAAAKLGKTEVETE